MSTRLKTNLSADTLIQSVIIGLAWLWNALPSTMICSWLSMTSISAFGKLPLKKWKNLSLDLNTPRLPTTLVELSLPPDLVWSSLQSKMVSTSGISRINPINPLKLWALPPPLPSSSSNNLSKVSRELNLWLMVTKWVSLPSVKCPWPWESAKKMKKSPLLPSGTVKSRSVNSFRREESKCVPLTTLSKKLKKLEKLRKTRCVRLWRAQGPNVRCLKRKPTRTT